MSASRTRRRRRPWYRRISRAHVAWGAAAIVGVLVAVFSYQAVRASSDLRLAANQAELLQDQIVAGDDAAARETLDGLRESTARARETTGGPLWVLGSKIPLLGRNVSAVRTVSRVADRIATDALPPVVGLSRQLNLSTFSPRDGRIDLTALAEVAPSLRTADAALGSADAELRSIDTDSLLVPLRGPVGTIQAKIAGASSATSSSALAARLLPRMLGAEDTRRYLLLVQNNAEIRSTGGIPGSFAVITAKDGAMTLGRQGAYRDLPQFADPVVPMTDDESVVFAPTLVTNILDTTITPHFPRTAEISRAMVAKKLGIDVDGVISVDPVAMSYLLGGTGPVQVTDSVAIDQANAVDVLLNKTYLTRGPEQQDEVFEAAARRIFDVISSGQGDPRLVLSGLAQAAAENRLMVWSSHEAEQRDINGTGVSGELVGDDGRTPRVGVYLGDAASTKMEYYLDHTTVVTAGRCLAGGVQELSTSTDLVSDAPATGLPSTVTGDGRYTPKGTMRLVVRLLSPFEGGFTDVRLDGVKQTVYADQLDGRTVTKVIVTLRPGQTATIRTTMITGRGQDRGAILSTTPGVQSTRNDVRSDSACD